MIDVDPGSVSAPLPPHDQADEIAARALAQGDLAPVADYLERFALPVLKFYEWRERFHSAETVYGLIALMRAAPPARRLKIEGRKGHPSDPHRITRDLWIGAWIHKREGEGCSRKAAVADAMKEFEIAKSKAQECLNAYRARFRSLVT